MTRPTPVPNEAATAEADAHAPPQGGRRGGQAVSAPTADGTSAARAGTGRPATPSGAADTAVPADADGTPGADGVDSTESQDNTDRPEPDGAVESTIEALWREFSRSPSQRVRDRLVLHYAPLVKYVAGRVGTGLPTHVDVADLIQSGIFGLVDAIEKFDVSRGLRFETYAMQRIRGAILDDLRSQDWVPRVVRSRAREVERAHERLGARLRRTPTDAEVAAELGIGLRELRDLYGQLRLTSVVALDDLVGPNKDSGVGSPAETLPDDGAVDPAAVLVDEDNRKQLAEAIAQLTERDRIVVSLYYFENLTLAEIGKVLGVTESRVSQLHTRAVLRLRAKLVENASS
ncbi:RNA polymerase subunit sigma-28 [Saccharomonospora piscinae]|uniref:RNA polymerase sigma factor n=1 Tax=Saccharomonospora piscinae TaxID=687388 RepID=A0A1V8ZZ79_SACPI|nr:FliA/WhiG family RNA polymerase sigma factor [Saccharomonospora piscinae]OQO90096.1 RNA polymerase subunit sigma-28 [Saccharomonospora piscinae]